MCVGKLSNHLLDGAFYKYSTLFNPYHYSPSAAIAGLVSFSVVVILILLSRQIYFLLLVF